MIYSIIKIIRYNVMGICLMVSWANLLAQLPDRDIPVGWAVVPGNGLISTTGGGEGEIVTATTAAELAQYAKSSSPLVIRVEGTLSGIDRIDVASNKTIIGTEAGAILDGIQLNLSNVSNIIIRNLTIFGAVDAIATRGSHHVWIDHCNVSNCGDGLIDITNQSDYHTVSWTRFSNHHKTMLINSGTDKPEDMGTLNTTLHHNWWDGSDTRNPRVGYGKVHVLNCFYQGNDYGIGLHSQCRVLAERNYFFHTSNPIQQMYREDPLNIHHGFCESLDNQFQYTIGKNDSEGISFIVDDYYLYDFFTDPVDSVPNRVMEGAGPGEGYCELGLIPVPGNGAVGMDTTLTLRWTKGEEVTEYIIFFGESDHQEVMDTLNERTCTIDSLEPGRTYYWRVDQLKPDTLIEGKLWQFRCKGPIPGRPQIDITSPADQASFLNGENITIEADALDSDNSIKRVDFYDGFNYLGKDTLPPYSFEWGNVQNGTYSLLAKVNDNNGKRYESEPVTVVVGHGITGLPEGYTLCSYEGETCSVDGLANIAFGSSGRYSYKYFTTADQECSSANFEDPIEGLEKACYKLEFSHPYVAITHPVNFSSFTASESIFIEVDAIDGNGYVDSVEYYINDTVLGVAHESPFSFLWQYAVEGNHTLTAKAIDNDGESYTSEGIRIYVTGGALNSLSSERQPHVLLFPNPISNTLIIKFNQSVSGSMQITISNTLGEIVLSRTIIPNNYVQLDVADLPSGIYYIRFDDKQNQTSEIFIKE